ncbi:hypothetical protein [Paucibacter soli]|uniref:hypothetical protein n=1 Tax=Paucibacter soli TaxID=3133433 RepID=UPI0030B77E17
MTATDTDQKFALIFKPEVPGDGHRLFKELATQRIVIADASGSTPDRCDDGPLYVTHGAQIEIVLSTSGSVVAVVRATDSAGCKARVWTSPATAAALQKLVPLTVMVEDKKIVDLLAAFEVLGFDPMVIREKLGYGDYEWQGRRVSYLPDNDEVRCEHFDIPPAVAACVRFAYQNRFTGRFTAGGVELFCHG